MRHKQPRLHKGTLGFVRLYIRKLDEGAAKGAQTHPSAHYAAALQTAQLHLCPWSGNLCLI